METSTTDGEDFGPFLFFKNVFEKAIWAHISEDGRRIRIRLQDAESRFIKAFRAPQTDP